MFCLVLFFICLFITIAVGGLAGWSDIRGMVIPNLYSALIGCAFFAAFAGLSLAGKAEVFAPLWAHLLAAFLMFAVTALMFFGGLIGAADSKLGTVLALWTGLQGFLAFLVYMALFGGVLGLLALYIAKKKPFKAPPAGSWPAQVQAGASKVPYGVAIVLGAFVAFVQIGYLDTSFLWEFFNEGGS